MTWLLFLLACDPKDQDLPPDETIEDTGDPQATEDTASTERPPPEFDSSMLCASCHTRRIDLTGTFEPGDAFLDHFQRSTTAFSMPSAPPCSLDPRRRLSIDGCCG